MKKIISLTALALILTFIFSFFSVKSVNAQPIENGKVTVSGCGQVTLVPDTAMICIGVITTADTLEQANTENKEKINKLYETLKTNEITDENIQTKNFYAHEEYSYKETEQTLIGYTVSNQVFVKTTNLEKLTDLVSSLISDGANNFNGVNFSSSKESESYRTALSNALADAKEKAKILTNSDNVSIVEIVEESVSSFRNFLSYGKAEMMSDNSFFGGELLVKARVTVVFTAQINNEEITENQIALEETKPTKPTKNDKKTNTNNEQNLVEDDTKQDNNTNNQKIDVNEPTQTIKNENNTNINSEIDQNSLTNETKNEQTSAKSETTKTTNETKEQINVSEPTEITKPLQDEIKTTRAQEKPITLPNRPIPRRSTKPTSPQII